MTGDTARRAYTLLGADGRPYRSAVPGTLGGHRRTRLYGRLDCPSALRALARGHYAAHRVFFPDEATAVAAGYRPCARCLPRAYARWKAATRATGAGRESGSAS
ncbi:Ada metal-binding domain-containing protein [Streptomyces sp. Tu 3180]|uniref:Ada metal-binding domain-containing protein n=1 Tax=Streptomyces sp. Tu 3180 TaxID=2682611 RepID=UPI001356A0CD|nr:Ada metal-binding domain-containing protein [Streptomyces sp. Tu 3180]KAF3468730.1 metal-binding protein [Streptomyces sp. Tu 3180]